MEILHISNIGKGVAWHESAGSALMWIDSNLATKIEMLNGSERKKFESEGGGQFIVKKLSFFFPLFRATHGFTTRWEGACIRFGVKLENAAPLLSFTFVRVCIDSFYCVNSLHNWKYGEREGKMRHPSYRQCATYELNATNGDRRRNWDENKKSKLKRRMLRKMNDSHMSFVHTHSLLGIASSSRLLLASQPIAPSFFFVSCFWSFQSFLLIFPFAFHFIPFHFHLPSTVVAFSIILLSLNAMCIHVLIAIKAHTLHDIMAEVTTLWMNACAIILFPLWPSFRSNCNEWNADAHISFRMARVETKSLHTNTH